MRMTPHDDLDALLPELRRQHRSTEAPVALEPLLRATAERSTAPHIPAWRQPSWTSALTAAALLLALVSVFDWSTHLATQHGSATAPLQAMHPPASPALSTPSHASPDPSNSLRPASLSQAQHSLRRKPAANTASQQSWQSKFVALPASEGLPPATAVSLIRMRIQQSALQQYGLEVLADSSTQTLLAEFMVGEDGLPRAVRILQ
jgi:hypothetical protein